MCFAVYIKKLKMWFLILNLLWIFFQKKIYVIQSAEKKLNTSVERSDNIPQILYEYSLNPDTSAHSSLGSFPLESVLSSITMDDDIPSTNVHIRNLETTTLNTTPDESEINPSLPFVNLDFSETEDMCLFGVSDELTDKIEEEPLWKTMISGSTMSQPMNTESIMDNPKGSELLHNLGTLNDDFENEMLEEIQNSFIYWDSNVWENYVKNALKFLPEAEGDYNNKSQDISCQQVEGSTENIASESGIELKSVGPHQEVVFDNATFIDVSEKKAMKETNCGNVESARLCENFSKYKIVFDKVYINVEFIKKMIRKLAAYLVLHEGIQKKELDEAVERIEHWIHCKSGRLMNTEHINGGANKIIHLFLNIGTYVRTLKRSQDLTSVFGFLNSNVIFNTCLACLSVTFHKAFTNRIHYLKGKLLQKRIAVLDVLETFFIIDESKNFVYLRSLLTFFNLEKNFVINCLLKWGLKLEQNNSPFNNMHRKLKKYHNRFKSLYSFSKDLVKIFAEKEVCINEKAQNLKTMLESHIVKLITFMSELEDEQKNLIKELSHEFSNVTDVATFLFYNMGKMLLMLLNWNYAQKNKFLYIMTVFNQLIIACGDYVDDKGDLTKEISAVLTEKEYLLQASFENMFLCIYMALISQLKLLAEDTLEKIKKETDILGITNVFKVLEIAANFKLKMKLLDKSAFSVLVDINTKKKELQQYELTLFKMREINKKVKELMLKVLYRSMNTKKKS